MKTLLLAAALLMQQEKPLTPVLILESEIADTALVCAAGNSPTDTTLAFRCIRVSDVRALIRKSGQPLPK